MNSRYSSLSDNFRIHLPSVLKSETQFFFRDDLFICVQRVTENQDSKGLRNWFKSQTLQQVSDLLSLCLNFLTWNMKIITADNNIDKK